MLQGLLPTEWQHALCVPLERSINHVLRYDPNALSALAPHQGRLLCLNIDDFACVRVRILPDGISLALGNSDEADTCLQGSLADFSRLALAEDKTHLLMSSDIELNGDTDFALAITRIAQRLDIDWEALISPLSGGLVAHELGKGLRGLLRWGKTLHNTYQSSLKTYIEDEAQLVVSGSELAYFAENVDQAKLHLDRLNARFERIIAQRQAASSKE